MRPEHKQHMRSLAPRNFLDRWAIATSTLCMAHCLLTPLLIVLVPVLASTVLADERFHRFMLLWIVPTSVSALWIGCRRHGNVRVLATGLAGLSLLVAAALWGEAMFGELAEKAATLSGSLVMSAGHWRNYRLCREESCEH
jgi:hypothetical protein